MKPAQSLNIGVFNVRGCSTNEVKNSKIGERFLKRRLDVCAPRETKLKRKCEVMFGKLVGRVSGASGGREGGREGWREGEGIGGPVTMWVVAEVCNRKARGHSGYVG